MNKNTPRSMTWLATTPILIAAVALASGEWVALHDQGLAKALKTQSKSAGYAPCQRGFFRQLLNHSDPASVQWQQQYQWNGQFWKPGGPVFLMLGGEGPASCNWLEHDTNVMINAQRFGAAVYQLEHRFYGDSQPFNATPGVALSVENLRHLTSRQAIEDAATFIIDHILKEHGEGTKVISFGGSYSGALSAWLRQKKPALVHAALSTSSPILAVENFMEYQTVVMNSLSDQNCILGIEGATMQIQSTVANDSGRAAMSRVFNTCKPIGNSSSEVANFMATLAQNYDGVVQYNNDNRGFESPGSPAPPTIKDVCAPFDGNGSTLQRYIDSQKIMFNFSAECMDVSYGDMIESMRNTSLQSEFGDGTRQWTWQTCNEFGYFQSSDGKSPFGNLFPVGFFSSQCSEIFGVSEGAVQTSIAETNLYYGGLTYETDKVMFINGDIDPWHVLSHPPLAGNPLGVTGVLMHRTAHCANMYPPSSNDVPDLTQTRILIADAIESWLAI